MLAVARVGWCCAMQDLWESSEAWLAPQGECCTQLAAPSPGRLRDAACGMRPGGRATRQGAVGANGHFTCTRSCLLVAYCLASVQLGNA